MRFALVVLALASGCFQSSAQVCGEFVCPSTKRCSPAGDSCVNPDQVAICDQAADRAPCTTSEIPNGICLQGVCILAGVCGNGLVEPGEVCDDGNVQSGDGCSKNCDSLETCGNGVLDPATEQCDCGADAASQPATCAQTNSDAPGVTCRTNCRFARCGDGVRDPDEQCDGADLGAQTCTSIGEYDGTLACRPNCQLDDSACQRCGDGVVNGAEECDPALAITKTCAMLGYYGSGSATCTATCAYDTSQCGGRCGDGMKNGVEVCDGSDLGGVTDCMQIGFYQPGTVTCTPACSYDTTMCVGRCGDHMKNGTEECDDAALGGATCLDLGYYQPDGLACTSFCGFDTTGCMGGRCGDGMVNGNEQCDSAPPPTATCLDYNYDYGPLGCNLACTPALGGCVHMGWSIVGSFPSDMPLSGVWADSDTDIVAVGQSAGYRYDGTKWTRTTALAGYTHVWGSGPMDVWATSGTGALEHWNGTSWNTVTVPTTNALSAIWGTGPTNIYIATSVGTVLHYNGSTWTESSAISATGFNITTCAIWGSGPSDIYIADYSGLFHYNGSAWAPVAVTGGVPGYFGVTGTAANNVWIDGGNPSGSETWHWNGSTWTSSALPDVGFTAATETASDDVFTITTTALYRWNGVNWDQPPLPVGGAFGVGGIWTWTPGHAVATGGHNVLLYRTGYWRTPAAISGTVNAIYAAAGNAVVAVGFAGYSRRFDGQTWSDITGTTNTLNGVWASSSTDIFAGGADSALGGVIYHSTGSTWTAMTVNGNPSSVGALWGSGPTDVWAVGLTGEIHHYTGSWSKVGSGTTQNLMAVWGSGSSDVFAAGGNGNTATSAVILHWNGSSWSSMTTPGGSGVTALAGSGPSDVYAFANTFGVPALWHYNGSAWSVVTGAPVVYHGAARSPTDAWMIDGSNGLYHYDGTMFERVRPPTVNPLNLLTAVHGRLFLVADQIYDLARSCDCL
jgi:cysteine-rich repeat protein